jgi:uncharacterized protein (DUF2267 family)
MSVNFERFAQEGNEFINELADKLGHPQEKATTMIILRSVLAAIRNSITVAESLDFISQMPMPLKALYVDQWKFREKPERINSIEDFKTRVKLEQVKYGESQFDWPEHTDEIIKTVISCLGKYVSEGQMEHVRNMMSKEVQPLFDTSKS